MNELKTPVPADLPPPDAIALAHSERLQQHIREEIDRAGGQIPFARFMDLALYAPGLGYYSAGARKFGPEGDFITAPEISPLFARCMARQCAQVLERLGRGDILEFGAGSGALATSLLSALADQDRVPDRYFILEVSADLRERQRRLIQERLPAFVERVHWLDTLPQERLQGVVLANEVLDALPVHRFRVEAGGIGEFYVTWEGNHFVWRLGQAPEALTQAMTRLQQALLEPLAPGYTSEVNLAAGPWIATIGAVLEAGLVLLIDYGFPHREHYHPQRHEGTLMCHYRHRVHGDPLILVGLQDITAHVDFSAVAEAAHSAGLSVAGYTTQADFLLATGLLDYAVRAGGDARAQWELAQQVKLLTLPSEMGELFKVMALTRGIGGHLTGFSRSDQRGRL
jgi:SAM-dependent MidA family methyltransferase